LRAGSAVAEGGVAIVGSWAVGAGVESVAEAIEPPVDALKKGCIGLMRLTSETATEAGRRVTML
jgi:hypothetical protein